MPKIPQKLTSRSSKKLKLQKKNTDRKLDRKIILNDRQSKLNAEADQHAFRIKIPLTPVRYRHYTVVFTNISLQGYPQFIMNKCILDADQYLYNRKSKSRQFKPLEAFQSIYEQTNPTLRLQVLGNGLLDHAVIDKFIHVGSANSDSKKLVKQETNRYLMRKNEMADNRYKIQFTETESFSPLDMEQPPLTPRTMLLLSNKMNDDIRLKRLGMYSVSPTAIGSRHKRLFSNSTISSGLNGEVNKINL